LQNKAGSALKSPAILKPKRDACRRAKLRCSTSRGDLVSSDPMTVARTFSFHVSALREGDEITEGKAVSFETGPDPKTGKIKPISVDLT